MNFCGRATFQTLLPALTTKKQNIQRKSKLEKIDTYLLHQKTPIKNKIELSTPDYVQNKPNKIAFLK